MKKSANVSPLEKHLGYWMRFVSNHVSHSFSQKLEAHGVTVAEWVVLRELLKTGETAPSQLADNLGLTRGAVSKLIERLVSKTLIDRMAGEADRRYQRIALTKAGRSLVPQLAELADQNDIEFFGHLAPDQHQALLTILQEIVRQHQLKGTPLD